jgi:hypothetical protein
MLGNIDEFEMRTHAARIADEPFDHLGAPVKRVAAKAL